jgi:hypothetical protein
VVASSAPALTAVGGKHVYVAVRGGDDGLWMKVCSAGCEGNGGDWTDWFEPFPHSGIRGVPSLLSDEIRTLHVFVQGLVGKIWWNGYDDIKGSTAYWSQVADAVVGYDSAHQDCYSPTASMRNASDDSYKLEVTVRGTDDQLWKTIWGEGGVREWSKYQRLGGILKSAPATIARRRSVDRIDVAAIMQEEHEAGTWDRGVWWKAWPSR